MEQEHLKQKLGVKLLSHESLLSLGNCALIQLE